MQVTRRKGGDKMKQFSKILKFELKNYLANKVFVGITIFLVVLIAVVMFFPRIMDDSGSGESVEGVIDRSELPVMLVSTSSNDSFDSDDQFITIIKDAFEASFIDYNVQVSNSDVDSIKEQIKSGDIECAFVLDGFDSYTYYVNNYEMYDDNDIIAEEVMQTIFRMVAMVENGLSPDVAQSILTTQIKHETFTIGKNQMQNYFYTYIMIFALYMVILLYGQMVATNVATEKSSRAMEVLITSAKPVNMMFGKVIASCIAGLTQLIAVFGSAFICFNLNRSYWKGNMFIESIFDMPLELLIYMLIFFILGFFIYAFLYGAIGSTASKLEDINTSVMPITVMFVISFIIVVTAMSSGSVDTTLMKVCSFIPFTSPMAMFTRIAMSTVPFYEIVVSIAILIGSVVGVGIISAKIYRIGVLLYGTPPKLGAIIKAIKKS